MAVKNCACGLKNGFESLRGRKNDCFMDKSKLPSVDTLNPFLSSVLSVWQ